jgi:hypothetical protein
MNGDDANRESNLEFRLERALAALAASSRSNARLARMAEVAEDKARKAVDAMGPEAISARRAWAVELQEAKAELLRLRQQLDCHRREDGALHDAVRDLVRKEIDNYFADRRCCNDC